MNINEKKVDLANRIYDNLSRLIDRDYVLLSLPYHYNIGDTLIYEGEIDFFKLIPYNCIYSTSTFNFDDRKIPQDALIIFHGGGNFGDVYRDESEFKNQIIRKYPRNKILLLPQTVYYKDEKNLKSDADLFAKCSDLTICARDSVSFDLLSKHFISNKIILVPDMAFCIDNTKLTKVKGGHETLFLRRTDVEFCSSTDYTLVPANAIVADWPTITHVPLCYFLHNYLRHIVKLALKISWNSHGKKRYHHYIDNIWKTIILPYNVKEGIRFINSYENVYTTRLHGAILSALLEKKVYLYDNIYGKNSSFFNTWLSDVDNIKLI